VVTLSMCLCRLQLLRKASACQFVTNASPTENIRMALTKVRRCAFDFELHLHSRMIASTIAFVRQVNITLLSDAVIFDLLFPTNEKVFATWNGREKCR
jgi:hypothetical protein